ncbi:hypothetical protein N7520_010916 [Penicillium odoratum]|uniref:uncharacterized protein n=1 Tax=Penicillium odoratum TaxID=1167516 RepID=UPI0025474E1C|nr:uncharacterized protein N7520_010916 [Penicillium odoratum]KAJ5745734.1 hypothetical protein N7520_010916 [Penicillium odoratum]
MHWLPARSAKGAPQTLPPHPERDAWKEPSLPHNSVVATHLASPGLLMQLFYGPTSNFSLMQRIYLDLIPGYAEKVSEMSKSVTEEGSAGLEMFDFRHIFFGFPESSHEGNTGHGRVSAFPIFIPYPVAKSLLLHFLETLYYLMPFHPKEVYEQRLKEMYDAPIGSAKETPGDQVLLMAIAIAAINSEHHRLADTLFECVNSRMAAMMDIVNLEMVQTSLIMMSFPVSQRS